MKQDCRISLRDSDRRIWEEEIEPILPRRIFDVHTHIYRREHIGENSPAYGLGAFADVCPNAGWAELDAADAVLLPGRSVHRAAFGFPFQEVDFEAINRFTVEQSRRDPESAAFLLVNPRMSAEHIEEQLRLHGFVGLKPYRLWSTGDPAESRITEFLPEEQMQIADRYGLPIVLQLSKRRGVADPDNIADLERLTDRYPNVRWIMAHCARGFYPQPLERVGKRLAELPNVYFDTAAVCEYGSYDYLLGLVGPGRILYGSDNLPACADRGKYITWAEGWAHFNEDMLERSGTSGNHCDMSMTFILYEVLRALCRAIRRHGLNASEIRSIFHDSAAGLVAKARASVKEAHG